MEQWERDMIEGHAFELAAEARRRARKCAPKAGATRKIADKRNRPPKHKKPLREDV